MPRSERLLSHRQYERFPVPRHERRPSSSKNGRRVLPKRENECGKVFPRLLPVRVSPTTHLNSSVLMMSSIPVSIAQALINSFLFTEDFSDSFQPAGKSDSQNKNPFPAGQSSQAVSITLTNQSNCQAVTIRVENVRVSLPLLSFAYTSAVA